MLRKMFFIMVALGSSSVFAADRVLKSQGSYVSETASEWEVFIKILLFIMGLGAIAFGGWNLLKDYVFAKSDHEVKFSIGKLIVGMLVGSVLCVPYSAIVVGGDLTGGTVTDSSLTNTDFERKAGN